MSNSSFWMFIWVHFDFCKVYHALLFIHYCLCPSFCWECVVTSLGKVSNGCFWKHNFRYQRTDRLSNKDTRQWALTEVELHIVRHSDASTIIGHAIVRSADREGRLLIPDRSLFPQMSSTKDKKQIAERMPIWGIRLNGRHWRLTDTTILVTSQVDRVVLLPLLPAVRERRRFDTSLALNTFTYISKHTAAWGLHWQSRGFV